MSKQVRTENVSQASRVFKSIFELQNYKIDYSLNTRGGWRESGTVRVVEYRKAVTKTCVVWDIILNWNKECGTIGEIIC
jgi:hypothetical protein